MATITPIAPGLTGAAESTPATPAANDTIPCAAYRAVLVIMTSSTGTPTFKFDDPTTPPNARPRESIEIRTLAFF